MRHMLFLPALGLLTVSILGRFGATDNRAAIEQAAQWRAEHRTIDLHQHIDYTTNTWPGR